MKNKYFNLIMVFVITFALSQNVKANNNFYPYTATVSTTDLYAPGTTMDLYFTLDYFSAQWDYGDFISLTFPEGITPNSSPTDPFAPVNEGQGTEDLNPISGQEISWGSNDDDGWGGIENGAHEFIVNVTIDADVSGDQVIDIVVSSSGYGGVEDDINTTVTIQELLSAPDLGVVAVQFGYTNYPLSQASSLPMAAEVSNYGLDLDTETDLVVTSSLSSYDEAMAISIPLENGESEILDLPSFTASIEGSHEIVFSATATDDPYLSNNSDTITIGIDSVYAHDDGSRLFAYGHTTFNYSIGTVFEIVTADELTAVQFYLAESTSEGMEFSLSVCPISLNSSDQTFTCGDAVWESEDLLVDESMEEAWTTVNTDNAVAIEEGTYALFIHEQTGGNSIELGHDGNNTGDILMSVNDENFYWEDESYGYAMLRLVFGEDQINTGIGETVNKEEISFFPNPTTGIVNISNVNKQNVIVYTLKGEKLIEINDASYMETIDISNYPSGTYILQVGSKKERINLIK